MEAAVVVVGGGGSGLAAAIEAATNGVSVILLEKNPALGGTTAWSIGSISATQTAYQRRMGIVDTPQEHYEDMALFSKKYTMRPDNDALRQLLTENIPDTMRWLGEMGVVFFGPLEEPPHRKPRMHNVMPNSRAYIYHLERRARQLGVKILINARATHFVMKEAAVVGVEFDQPDSPGLIAFASRGVVLASGDYSASAEMKRKFISDAVADTDPINVTSTGDGQRMGLEIGARILNGDMFNGGIRFMPPAHPSWISRLPPVRWLMRLASVLLTGAPQPLVRKLLMGFLTTVMVPAHELFANGAILVNRNGERFSDETQKMVFELAHQPGGIAHIVFDTTLAENFSRWPHYISTAPGFAYAYLGDYKNNRPDLVYKGDTLEELAAALEVDAGKFTTSVTRYNSDDPATPFPRCNRPQLTRGPYYALGPVKNYINFTDGGLAVNEKLQVLGAGNQPIPGLYAAGSSGQGGALLKGHGHHIGWAMTSGQIAGRHAAGRIGV